ncbi:MAG TPA: M10 family metallopeptidase C-terminal domain-containing protein [Allosphingosinicella sp.]|nr:M10 family metallopeptidase C-terminal domain-containing protein [Allosphingosinicella sp.]
MPTAPRYWDGDAASIDILARFDTPRQRHVGAIQLANGDIWMFWTDSLQANAPEFGTDLVGVLFDAYGRRKTGTVVLNSGFFSGNEAEPNAAALPSGEFILAFSQERPNGIPADPTIDIVIEKRLANGNYGGGLRIATDPANGERIWFGNPEIAVASATNGLVVYQRMSGGTWDICFQRFDPSTMTLLSTPGGGVVLDNDRNLTDPRVALLSSGNYLVAFTSTAANNGADREAYFRIYNASGAPVTALTGLNPSGREFSVEIAVLTGGRFAIGFDTTNGTRVEVYSDAGALLLGVNVGGNSLSDLLPTADGGFVAVNGSGEDVGFSARTYDANGQLVGQSTGIGGDAYDYAVTPLADGRFFGAGLFHQDFSGIVYATGDIFDTRATPTAPAYPSATQFGTPGNDDVEVSAAAAIFNGGPGDDIIRDHAAAATTLLMGGEGNDTIVLRGLVAGVRARGGDLVSDEGDFDGDTLEMTQESARVFFNMNTGVLSRPSVQATAFDFEHYRHVDGGGEDSVIGTAGVNRIETGPGNDTLNGEGGNDILIGGAGADGLLGGTGNDILYVDDAGDIPAEAAGEGIDRVLASVSFALPDNDDTEIEFLSAVDPASTAPINLTGNRYGQTITGNAGANALNGGGGDDLLSGGLGHDRLAGGTGADSFVFGQAADSRPLTLRSDGAKLRPDTIGDFTSGQDRIDLSAIDANRSTAANDAFTFIGAAAFGGQAGQLRYQVAGGVVRIEGDVDGDALADFAIIAITPAIQASDFVL